jgi:hypothetical protein
MNFFFFFYKYNSVQNVQETNQGTLKEKEKSILRQGGMGELEEKEVGLYSEPKT